MGKTRRAHKELNREQKLIYENKQLKRENGRLRKELAKLDLNRFDFVKEMLEEHDQQETSQTGTELLENLKRVWLCSDCRNGYLEIFIYNKLGSPWYYRICSNSPGCKNRTKSQKYTPQVRGIMKKVENND